jgi:CheY-like chemotaxis protein
MKDDHEQCLAAGANDYLAKPIDLERLFSLLRVWMPKMERLNRSRLPSCRVATPPLHR